MKRGNKTPLKNSNMCDSFQFKYEFKFIKKFSNNIIQMIFQKKGDYLEISIYFYQRNCKNVKDMHMLFYYFGYFVLKVLFEQFDVLN